MSKRAHPFDHTAVAEADGDEYWTMVSAADAKQRRRDQRANAAQPDFVRPTPERLAKVAEDQVESILVPVKEDTTRASHRVTKVRTAFETLSDKMTEEDVAALARWAKIYFEAQAGRSVISSYGEGGGAAYGPRAGGVPDHARAAHNECVALATYMGAESYRLFVALCCEIADRHDALQGLIREPYRNPWKGTQADRIFQAGMLRVLAMFIRWYENRERGLERSQRSAQEIAAANAARRERMWGRK